MTQIQRIATREEDEARLAHLIQLKKEARHELIVRTNIKEAFEAYMKNRYGN